MTIILATSQLPTVAKESGLPLLTLPPHCSQRTQPLDVCVLPHLSVSLLIKQMFDNGEILDVQ